MKRIKNYFANWDAARYLRLVLGIIFGFAYAFDGQVIYLMFSVFLLVQAVMNIGCGCSTVNCSTNVNSKKETTYQIEKLNTNKNDV